MLRDPAVLFQEQQLGVGGPWRYELTVSNVESIGLVVKVAGVTINPTTGLILDGPSGAIVFTSPPVADAEILITGYHHKWITDEDLATYIGIATSNYEQAEGANIDRLVALPAVANIIAIAGIVEALWALVTEFARDIDVSSPETNIPAHQRYQQMLNLLTMWTSELRRREQALNIGLYKIEVYTLRRVSRTTGRLVPEYVAQEFDDRSRPTRVYPPIDTGVQTPVYDDTPFPTDTVLPITMNLTGNRGIIQGKAWEIELNIDVPELDGIDLAGYTVEAAIFDGDFGEDVLLDLTVVDLDLTRIGELTFKLTLDAAQTAGLDASNDYVWAARLLDPDDIATPALQGTEVSVTASAEWP
jgi:hypothetical protein